MVPLQFDGLYVFSSLTLVAFFLCFFYYSFLPWGRPSWKKGSSLTIQFEPRISEWTNSSVGFLSCFLVCWFRSAKIFVLGFQTCGGKFFWMNLIGSIGLTLLRCRSFVVCLLYIFLKERAWRVPWGTKRNEILSPKVGRTTTVTELDWPGSPERRWIVFHALG